MVFFLGSSIYPTMGRVCLHCGDKGFSNAFIYCVKCLNDVVHRYCLDKLPETFDEFVYWVCDDCETELPEELTSAKSNPIQSEGSEPKSSKDVDGQLTVVKSKRKKPGLRLGDRKRKRASLSTKEANRRLESNLSKQLEDAELANSSSLSTELKKKEGSCSASEVEDHRLQLVEESTGLELTEKSNSTHDQRNHTSSKDVEGQGLVVDSEGRKRRLQNRVQKKKRLLAEEAKRRLESSPSEQPQDAELAASSPLSTELKKKEALFSASEVEDHRLQPDEANTKLELTEKRNRAHESSLLEESQKKTVEVKFSPANLSDQSAKECLEASQLASDHLENNSTLDSHEHAQPLIEPIWRGGFIILNKDYDAFDGLVAHLSRKACQMAYEEANMFPSLLDLEMFPKSDVWPKSFQKTEPSDDHIALYFFPSDKRYERLFDHLVEEMMNQELALKAIVKNAELLVFTSVELPLSYWRFQGKYYLWGVFKGKQTSSSQAVGCREGTTQETKLPRAKIGDGGSPLGPLSNSGSFGSGNF